VAVNLAFEAAPLAGEVLLVDADTYGGTVTHANMQEHHRIADSRAARLKASLQRRQVLSSRFTSKAKYVTRLLTPHSLRLILLRQSGISRQMV
jgi:Mrp family chromosome partitioning ATPase